MNVKAVVKVMNFHALLHVEAARREAEKYRMLEKELSRMMGLILNNRNLQLDKKIFTENQRGEELCIYIGSDLGFCGAINSSVAGNAGDKKDMDSIVIGKKIKRIPNQVWFVERDELENNWDTLQKIFTDAIFGQQYSKIFLVYNHYHNMSSIECVRKQIFPVKVKKNAEEAKRGDFVTTGDASDMLQSMMVTYLKYEIGMAAVSSFASENILRRNATTDSLKKIDEMEEEELWAFRKERSQKAFKKVIDSFIKKKGYGGSD